MGRDGGAIAKGGRKVGQEQTCGQGGGGTPQPPLATKILPSPLSQSGAKTDTLTPAAAALGSLSLPKLLLFGPSPVLFQAPLSYFRSGNSFYYSQSVSQSQSM